MLGVRSSHLRGAALSDLVYKPSTIEQEIEQEERRDEHKAVGRGGKGDEGEEEEEEEEKEERKEGSARSGAARDAYVEVVYSLSGEEELKLFPPASRPHDELRFRRSISRSGASVYRLNDVVMPHVTRTWSLFREVRPSTSCSAIQLISCNAIHNKCHFHASGGYPAVTTSLSPSFSLSSLCSTSACPCHQLVPLHTQRVRVAASGC